MTGQPHIDIDIDIDIDTNRPHAARMVGRKP